MIYGISETELDDESKVAGALTTVDGALAEQLNNVLDSRGDPRVSFDLHVIAAGRGGNHIADDRFVGAVVSSRIDPDDRQLTVSRPAKTEILAEGDPVTMAWSPGDALLIAADESSSSSPSRPGRASATRSGTARTWAPMSSSTS